MNIKKTSENVNRSYDNSGQMTDRLDSVQYSVTDDNGMVIGDATVWNSTLSVNYSLSGFDNIAAGEAKLKEALGVADSKPEEV